MLMIPSQNIRICTLAQLCHVVLFLFRFISTYIWIRSECCYVASVFPFVFIILGQNKLLQNKLTNDVYSLCLCISNGLKYAN